MKATLTLAIDVMFAAPPHYNTCAYSSQVDIKTVTAYVYPDSSPTTHLSAQPTGNSITYDTISDPRSSNAPSSLDSPSKTEKPAGCSKEGSNSIVSNLSLGDGSSSSSGSEHSADPSSVQEVSLNAHNAHRANHTSNQVEWDSDLAKWAQQLADSCSYGHDTTIGKGGYGQNIAMGAASDFSLTKGQAAARAITHQWYNNEFELYPNYGGEPDLSGIEEWGHLSHIIWADTTNIGCAIALCDSGELAAGMEGYFAVCNYKPEGNVKGLFAKNVLPAIGGMKILQA